MDTGEILLIGGIGLGAWYFLGQSSSGGGSIFSPGGGTIPPDSIFPDQRAGPGVLGPSTPNTAPGGDVGPSQPDIVLTGDVKKVAVTSKPAPAPKLPPGQTPDTIPHDGPGQQHTVVSFPSINIPTPTPNALANWVQSTVAGAKTAAKSMPAKVASAPPTAPRAGSGIPAFKKANL